MNFKKAFSLTEVLITLTILGVVAAISIPNIISNYQKKITVVKVKKIYSLLNSAYSQYLVSNPNPATFPYTKEGAIQAYEALIKPYISISYDAGTDAERHKKIMSDYLYKLDHSLHSSTLTSSDVKYVVKLKDGNVIMVYGSNEPEKSDRIAKLILLTNKKSKYTVGIDYFNFYFDKDGVQPIVSQWNDYFQTEKDYLENYCSKEGWGGAYWILVKGNMNYLKCRGKKINWETEKCK